MDDGDEGDPHRGRDMGGAVAPRRQQPKWTANSMIGECGVLRSGESCCVTVVVDADGHCVILNVGAITAGAGGGLVASIATCPLDVVKTKLQAQRAVQGQTGYLGIWGAD